MRGRRSPRARRAPRWAAGVAQGSTLSRAEAVATALGERAGAAVAGPAPEGRLTRRQREVAQLVAAGLTDREIAARLVISPRTAESHVQQILTRLGFRTRAQIAVWAAGRVPSPRAGTAATTSRNGSGTG